MPKTCNGCSTENKTPATVPYQVLKDFKETAKANGLKWFIFSMVLLVLFVGSNALWIWRESQYERTEEIYTETYDVEANDNGNTIYNDDGSVVIGENKGN